MIRVALVNPPWPKPISGTPFPPLNLGYLAGYLERYAREVCEVKIIDGLTGRNIENELLNLQPEIIGLTAMTPLALEAYKIADFSKQNLPHSLVVMGGVHASIMAQEALRHVDVVVRGEGELALLEIVRKVSEKKKNLKGG
jgi:anaerobic magnesium-protoporphyrin IX monomethyl ester cyclase